MSGRAWAELILLALIWGGSFLSFAVALREVGVLTIVLHRVGWAALCLWLVVVLTRRPLPVDPSFWLAGLVMGILNNAIPFLLIAWAQTNIESGLAAILNASTALFAVPLAAVAFRDERLSAKKVIGVLLGFLGVVIAIGADALRQLDIRSLAQLAILAAAMSYAVASLFGRRFLTGADPVMSSTAMLTGSTLVLLPITLAIDGVPSLHLSGPTLASIAYIALAATAGAYLLYYRVLSMAGAANLSLVTLIVPPTAVVLGALFLAESLPLGVFAGFGLLALGLLIIDGRVVKWLIRAFSIG